MINPTTTTENFNNTSLGADMERNILKEKMKRAAERCGSAVQQYYQQTGQTGHERKIKYVLKDLLYTQTEDAEYLCETIYEEANTHLPEAMKYGYKPEDLAELRKSIDEYRVLIKNKRQTIANKKKLDEIIQDFGVLGRRTA